MAPVLGLAGLALWISAPGPVIFTQDRTGQNGRIFRLYKLRTMTENPTRKPGQTRGDDPEILPVGHILRRFKIDELPQLWNILKGDMSVVGPRPLVPQMLGLTPDWAHARHVHRPGLTGPVQVRGGTTLSWTQRWVLDVQYRPTFWGDLGFALKTIGVVMGGEARFYAPACIYAPPVSYSTVTDFAKLRG